MEHGESWFSFWSVYQNAQHYVNTHSGLPPCEGEGCPLFTFDGLLFGNPATLQHVFAAILVVIVMLALSIRARMQLNAAGDQAVIPDPNVNLRNAFEWVLEKLYFQSRNIIGKDAARYFPVIATLAMFIFFCNILGLFPGFSPPTDNWNTTMACGGFVFLYYNYHGLRVQGWHHLAHIANPAGTWWGWFMMPLMLPIEIFGHLLRPFTLGVRLAANMTGDHYLLGTFLGLMPVLVPLPFYALGVFVCVVQTLVFILLTMAYVGLAVAESDDNPAHAHDHGPPVDEAATSASAAAA